jgi:AraC family transcriptional regulator of adaptative response/methylated-DNA-[protein]-cysteine methyltransferase
LCLLESLSMPQIENRHTEAVATGEEQMLADYRQISGALAFWGARGGSRVNPDSAARHLGLSAEAFRQLFLRWAGLTPTEFLDAVKRARAVRREREAPAFDFGEPHRPRDLAVAHQAVASACWKAGAGAHLAYGFHVSPFGEALVVAAPDGLAGLGWVDAKAAPGRAATDGKHGGGRDGALTDMRRRWPKAAFVHDQAATARLAARAFDPARWRKDDPLRVVLIGTSFELTVWRELLAVPVGATTTYSTLAARIGRPAASRAVGAAVGKNPISFVVPCHRALGKSGSLTGYHWGLARKQAILGWEAGQCRM